MTFGARKYKKKAPALSQAQAEAIAAAAGISEAAFLAAAADGEVTEAEIDRSLRSSVTRWPWARWVSRSQRGSSSASR